MRIEAHGKTTSDSDDGQHWHSCSERHVRYENREVHGSRNTLSLKRRVVRSRRLKQHPLVEQVAGEKDDRDHKCGKHHATVLLDLLRTDVRVAEQQQHGAYCIQRSVNCWKKLRHKPNPLRSARSFATAAVSSES